MKASPTNKIRNTTRMASFPTSINIVLEKFYSEQLGKGGKKASELEQKK